MKECLTKFFQKPWCQVQTLATVWSPVAQATVAMSLHPIARQPFFPCHHLPQLGRCIHIDRSCCVGHRGAELAAQFLCLHFLGVRYWPCPTLRRCMGIWVCQWPSAMGTRCTIGMPNEESVVLSQGTIGLFHLIWTPWSYSMHLILAYHVFLTPDHSILLSHLLHE